MRIIGGRGRWAVVLAALAVRTASLGGSIVTAQVGGQVESSSSGTAGGEADGLAALVEMFTAAHPDIEIVNAVIAGGAGTNYKPALTSRMQAGEPPDAFQAHGGAELANMWVAPDFTQPIGDLYDKLGLADKFPAGVIDLVSVDGVPYAVPVNVHRNGVLWFNKKVFEDNGVAAPTTWDEFFTAADTLKAAGVDPLALGDKDGWTAVNLFEQILLSQLGAEDYRGLWGGTVSWTDARVTAALETLARVLEYVNADHATLTWDQAAGKLLSGDAAMTVMGDWAKGYFTANGWAPDVDFGWASVPGTEGTFTVVTDTFAIAKDAKNMDNALLWLETVASQEGQDAFNPLKGSIPARNDADRSKYDVYSTGAMDAFASDELVPSQANGPATIPAFEGPLTDAISVFVTSGDVAGTQAAINQACIDSGACPAA
jgi:glucose/mannose transport system substrate-binding protein